MVADFLGDGFDSLRCGGEELSREPHAQVGDLVHGAAAELLAAEAPEVFVAVARFAGEPGEGPLFGKVSRHAFPKEVEAVVGLQGAREAEDIGMYEVDPMLDNSRFAGGLALVDEAEDGGMESKTFEASHHRRSGGRNGTLFRGLLITDPAEFPAHTRQGGKGIEGVRGEETGAAGVADTPAAVDKDFAFAAEAGEEVGGGLAGADDLSGGNGIHDSDMDNLIMVESGTDGKIGDPWARFNARRFNAAHAGAR